MGWPPQDRRNRRLVTGIPGVGFVGKVSCTN